MSATHPIRAGQALFGLYLAMLTLDAVDDALAGHRPTEIRVKIDGKWVPVRQAGEAHGGEGLGIDRDDQGDEEVRAQALWLRRRSDGQRLFVGFRVPGPRPDLEFELLRIVAGMASRGELAWWQPGWAFQAARPAPGGWEAL